MVKHLNVSASEVDALTQQLYYAYGTTMAGLAATGYELDFDHYHSCVHGTLDYQNLLSAQPATRQTLADLKLQKHILTNADAKHTAACLERMGLTDCFQVRTGGWWLMLTGILAPTALVLVANWAQANPQWSTHIQQHGHMHCAGIGCRMAAATGNNVHRERPFVLEVGLRGQVTCTMACVWWRQGEGD